MSTVSPVLAAPALRVGQARARAARPTGSVRLTRRGRVVVFVLALLVAAAVAMTLAAGSAASGEAGNGGAVDVVTVAPGDTLWGIASDVATVTGEADVREVMEHIQQLNTLDSSVVYAGQQLRVPAVD